MAGEVRRATHAREEPALRPFGPGSMLAHTRVDWAGRGAIALGHPLGASGARLTATLLNALEQRDGRFGLQVICEAGGLANAMVIERLPEAAR